MNASWPARDIRRKATPCRGAVSGEQVFQQSIFGRGRLNFFFREYQSIETRQFVPKRFELRQLSQDLSIKDIQPSFTVNVEQQIKSRTPHIYIYIGIARINGSFKLKSKQFLSHSSCSWILKCHQLPWLLTFGHRINLHPFVLGGWSKAFPTYM